VVVRRVMPSCWEEKRASFEVRPAVEDSAAMSLK
jgi:hypothetical protein